MHENDEADRRKWSSEINQKVNVIYGWFRCETDEWQEGKRTVNRPTVAWLFCVHFWKLNSPKRRSEWRSKSRRRRKWRMSNASVKVDEQVESVSESKRRMVERSRRVGQETKEEDACQFIVSGRCGMRRPEVKDAHEQRRSATRVRFVAPDDRRSATFRRFFLDTIWRTERGHNVNHTLTMIHNAKCISSN